MIQPRTRIQQQREARRNGLTLLEVMLALAILGVSIAVVGELIRIGTRSAAQARDLSTAQLMCESKLSEILAGIEPPSASSGGPLDEYGEWSYSVESESTDQEGLLLVRVTVQQNLDAGQRAASFTIARWMTDPGLIEEAEAADAEEAEAAAAEAEAAAAEAESGA